MQFNMIYTYYFNSVQRECMQVFQRVEESQRITAIADNFVS